MKDYLNVPRSIAAVISAKMATKVELDTVLSVEDVYDLLEIITVDQWNQQCMREAEEAKMQANR